jgi:hypothetical protein
MTDQFEPEDYDYGDHAPRAKDGAIKELHELIDRADAIEQENSRMSHQIEVNNRYLESLVRGSIPKLLAENGMDSLSTPSGLKVAIKTELYANIPAPTTIAKEKDAEKRALLIQRRKDGLAWLEANGHGNHIKRSFDVEFAKGNEEAAAKFRQELKANHDTAFVSEGETVNAASLTALCRRLAKDGVPLPTAALGVFQVTEARIHRAK